MTVIQRFSRFDARPYAGVQRLSALADRAESRPGCHLCVAVRSASPPWADCVWRRRVKNRRRALRHRVRSSPWGRASCGLAIVSTSAIATRRPSRGNCSNRASRHWSSGSTSSSKTSFAAQQKRGIVEIAQTSQQGLLVGGFGILDQIRDQCFGQFGRVILRRRLQRVEQRRHGCGS